MGRRPSARCSRRRSLIQRFRGKCREIGEEGDRERNSGANSEIGRRQEQRENLISAYTSLRFALCALLIAHCASLIALCSPQSAHRHGESGGAAVRVHPGYCAERGAVAPLTGAGPVLAEDDVVWGDGPDLQARVDAAKGEGLRVEWRRVWRLGEGTLCASRCSHAVIHAGGKQNAAALQWLHVRAAPAPDGGL